MAISLSISQTKKLIKKLYSSLGTANTQGLFLWGPPGIGKSDLVKQVAQELDLDIRDIRLPLLDPVDLRGLPVIDRENKVAEWLPPSFLPKEGNGILFLDEINAATPSVQASAYQLVLDKRIGNYSLPKGWIVIAAGNRLEDKTVTYRMPSALSNRFTHINIRVDLNEWLIWAKKNSIDELVIGFLSEEPKYLEHFKGRIFATPRSWHFVSNLREIKDDYYIYMAALEGTIGEEPSGRFRSYIETLEDKYTVEGILSGEEKNYPKERLIAIALSKRIANKLKSAFTENEFNNAIKFIDHYFDIIPDIPQLMYQEIIRHFKDEKKNDILDIIYASESYNAFLELLSEN